MQSACASTPLRTFEDDELIRDLRGGNGEAFAAIFNRYHRLVLVTALRILGDMGEAEDLAQSVFLEIYSNAGQFDPSRGTLKNWILQYAYHRSINRRNYLALRHFYHQATTNVTGEEDPWVTQVSPPTQEATRLVDEALALLNDRQRQVMVLVFFEGLSLKDVAERTGQTFANVRHHYYRGIQHLRDSLSTRRGGDAKRVVSAALGKTSPAHA
ncbi:MAG: sigma-70 family RNA polymerase sigma factor [Acidobacteriia bacterium]|nr:sigma-70 family RNA polymerase sigma factor [Terriglobia bacterium]